MKKLAAISLLDILPESILLDPKIKASAQALDAQFQAVTRATREVLHLPRLDALHGNIIDYLAEQFHLDFYEPLYLTESEKKNLIRESIAWHRIKGTPAAVEKIAHAAFVDSQVIEWFDYENGQPYHFKIRSHGFKETPDGWATYVRMLNAAKNVRSWCDNYEIYLDEDDFGIAPAYAGELELLTGDKTISLDKPKLDFQVKTFADTVNITFGNVTESLRRPNLKFDVVNFAAMAMKRVGSIKIDTSDAHSDESYFARSWTSKVFAGMSNVIFGKKFWNLSVPQDTVAKNFVSNVQVNFGKVTVDTERRQNIVSQVNVHAANILSKVGNVTIDTSDEHPDENYFGKAWTSKVCAAQVNLVTGSKTLGDETTRHNFKSKVRVGVVETFTGYVTIDCSENEPWPDVPISGDTVSLRYRFPNLRKRFITLKDPRDDLTKADIREVSDITTASKVLLNSYGQLTTGVDLAIIVKNKVITIF